MGAGAVELVVEGAVLMQHAIENIRCDPPRRETRHFGWQGETLGGHGAGTFRGIGQLACHREETQLCHGNMPNVRIALAISCRHPHLCRSFMERAMRRLEFWR